MNMEGIPNEEHGGPQTENARSVEAEFHHLDTGIRAERARCQRLLDEAIELLEKCNRIEGERREQQRIRELEFEKQRIELEEAKSSLTTRFEEIATLTRLLFEKSPPKIVVEKNGDVAALKAEITALKAKVEARDKSIASTRERIDRLKKSVSWKVTSPIRAAGRLIGGASVSESKSK